MKHKVIAICGLIGSGKSTVMRYLQGKGCATIDCDTIARSISNSSEVLEAVGELLGQQYIAGGMLDRAGIRQLVFGDDHLYTQYSEIFVTAINDRLLREIEPHQVVFVEIQVLSSVHVQWHSVWQVVCEDSVRIDRTIARDNTTAQDVVSISNRQSISGATHILHNNGDLQYLYRQIDMLLSNI